jgi:hypothetical protein
MKDFNRVLDLLNRFVVSLKCQQLSQDEIKQVEEILNDIIPMIASMKAYREGYNSKKAIQTSLVSYDKFYKLVSERHQAFYERKEKLEEFIVLGVLFLDSCGNVWKFEKQIKHLQPVLTKEEFADCEEDVSSILWGLPSRKCFYCGQIWDLENFLESHLVCEQVTKDLSAYTGKTYKEVNKLLKQETDAWYSLNFNEKEADNLIEHEEICTVKKIFHHDCMFKREEERATTFLKNSKENNYRFLNLAGNEFCDLYIKVELNLAGITINQQPQGNSEVPYTIYGTVNAFDEQFVFKRAWYYWTVKGNVPLKVAKELYDDPEGQQTVRVVSHCGCPSPEQWVSFVDDKPVISSYHIDSLQGLILFVKKIKGE